MLLQAENNNTYTKEFINEPQPLPETLLLPEGESLAKAALSNNFLIYATKDKQHLIVYKKNLKNGEESKIFEYDEGREADFSGNTWSGLPPSIDFNERIQKFAFSDKEGLKSF